MESVKLTGKRVADGTQSAYVDFVDINSATKAHDALIKVGERDLRIEYNNPDNAEDAIIGEGPHREYDVIHGARHSRYDTRRDG